MRRFILRSFIAGGVLASASLVADVEKLRPDGKAEGTESAKDKEKDQDADKPVVELGKPGEEQPPDEADHMAKHRQLEAEGEKNLKEIARLMEKIRNDLSQKQTGDATQGSQREVVKKIEELIDKINKGCGKSNCSSGSSSGQSQSQSQAKESRQKKNGSESQRSENDKQSANPDQKNKKGDQKKELGSSKEEPKGSGKVPNNRREEGKLPDSKTATLAEKAEVLERWGLLPKRIVEQMRSSSGKEYPAEYRDIISRYYERLSKLYEETNGDR